MRSGYAKKKTKKTKKHLAVAKEIGADAAVGTPLSALDGILTLIEEQKWQLLSVTNMIGLLENQKIR